MSTMNKLSSLPIIERTEFGFTRMHCSCRACSVWCEHVPGLLVPSDLERLIPKDADPFHWAEEHLRCSPGVITTIKNARGEGEEIVEKLPSLVPAKQANGHCHWLKEGRCLVHENAPYGCAFLDHRQSEEYANRVRKAGAIARIDAIRDGNSLYRRLLQHLEDKGLLYETNLEDRSKVAKEMESYHRQQREVARQLKEKEERRHQLEAKKEARARKKMERRRKARSH
jgi:hypothetical protein